MSSNRSVRICPSILSADFSHLARDIDQVLNAGADWIHVDIMDGHFVPNLTIGPPVVASLRRSYPTAFLDCHCMVSDIQRWVQALSDAGASQISFHPESLRSFHEIGPVIDLIKQAHMKCGVAIKPHTTVQDLIPFLQKNQAQIDTLLVMTVEPGFGGQKFMPEMMDKVRKLRQLFPEKDIQVDGGINAQTVVPAAESGANAIVAGTAIFNSHDVAEAIASLRYSVQSATRHISLSS